MPNEHDPNRHLRRMSICPTEGPIADAGRMIVLRDRSRPVASPLLDVPTAGRDRIARAVRRAVATMRRPAGGYHCAGYAAAGAAILAHRGFDVARQFGSFGLAPDPEDPTYMITWAVGSPGAMERGEFHAWLASRDGVVIDFSAPDWPAMVEDTTHRMTPEPLDPFPGIAPWGESCAPKADVRWERPRPDYLWCAWNELPDYVRYLPDPAATARGRATSIPPSGRDELVRLAIWLYRTDPAVVVGLPGCD
jgi:hypothetical protein